MPPRPRAFWLRRGTQEHFIGGAHTRKEHPQLQDILRARRTLDPAGYVDSVGFDLRPQRAPPSGVSWRLSHGRKRNPGRKALLARRSSFRYYGIDLQNEVEKFEAEFIEFLGVGHAVAVTSGTGALQTALGPLGVGPGQEISIPAPPERPIRMTLLTPNSDMAFALLFLEGFCRKT
jgi:hypothetical protein